MLSGTRSRKHTGSRPRRETRRRFVVEWQNARTERMQAHASPRCYMKCYTVRQAWRGAREHRRATTAAAAGHGIAPPSLAKIGMGKDLSPYSFAKNIDFYSTGGLHK